MASSSKKSKNDPLADAVSAIAELDVAYHTTTEDEVREVFTEMTIGLRADAGVIGTVEEEELYKQVMSEPAPTSAEQPEIASAEMREGQSAAANGSPSDSIICDEKRTNDTAESHSDTEAAVEVDDDHEEDQAPKEPASGDDETSEGEDEYGGRDVIILPDGEIMSVGQYFGTEWAQRIVRRALRSSS